METLTDNQEIDTEEELDAGGLPSANEDKQLELSKFAIDEDIKSKYFKDGKINGKYGTIQDLIEGAKSYEDKYSQLMREVKSGKYQEVQQQSGSKANTATVDTSEVVQPLIQEYVANGMELTDDIINKAVSQGVDIRDVKLAAIEIKDKIQSAYNIVGGEQEYKAMIEWGKTNLDDKSKASFDKELASGMGEFAIKGLYAEYKASNQSQQQPKRIIGDSSSQGGVRPYNSIDEIMRDRAYLNTTQGRNDAGAKSMYSKRMNITSDDVVFGRR